MNRFAAIVTVVPIVAIAAILIMTVPEKWRLIHILGLVLLLPGLVLLTMARVQLGSAFSISAQANTLVTRGLYSWIRNPIYVFGIPVITGLILYLNRPLYLLILTPLILLQITRARRESQVLEERFGEAYRQFKSRTWF
jgi:protein-S-isoprenylcysteine O-methyltransferase Ste14